MINGKKVSLVFPAFNEEKNIVRAIKEFSDLKIIDEIIVVDNNSSDNTSRLAKSSGAKVILEKKQGYGYALTRGLKESNGEYIILCEPDGTFASKDALRLLKEIIYFDVVIGTRTNTAYISPGANMHGLLRIANITLAKIIQLLYAPLTSLSDCGCTFRVMRKSVVKKIIPKLSVGSSHFLAELTVLCLKAKVSIKEIPVVYKERVGESKITGSFTKAVLVGIRMFQLALVNRFS